MQLPSQIDSLSILNQLEVLEETGSLENNNKTNDPLDTFPESASTWLLSQLKGAFNVKTPNYYPFPCSSKEMFSWVERNNQMAEETLRNLIYDDKELHRIKTELKEYSEKIPHPTQIRLNTPTPVDSELAQEDIYQKEGTPNCFIWKWGKFQAFVAPQEFDFNKIKDFSKELDTLKISPDAFILMPYSKDPLEQLDPCFGNELWHTFPPEEPLFWEETKVYLEALRWQEDFKAITKKNKQKKDL